jgi:hypothetical protein
MVGLRRTIDLAIPRGIAFLTEMSGGGGRPRPPPITSLPRAVISSGREAGRAGSGTWTLLDPSDG